MNPLDVLLIQTHQVTPSWDGNGILLTSECIEEGKGKPYTNKREIVDGQLILVSA